MSISLEIVPHLSIPHRQNTGSSEENGLESLVQNSPAKNGPSISEKELEWIISILVNWKPASSVDGSELLDGKNGILSEKILHLLSDSAERILSSEPALLELSGPLVIVGMFVVLIHLLSFF